jgi:hypothetical protein
MPVRAAWARGIIGPFLVSAWVNTQPHWNDGE